MIIKSTVYWGSERHLGYRRVIKHIYLYVSSLRIFALPVTASLPFWELYDTMRYMMIYLASDSIGKAIMEVIKTRLSSMGVQIEDLGAFASGLEALSALGAKLADSDGAKAMLIAKEGCGLSIIANRGSHIRAVNASEQRYVDDGCCHYGVNLVILDPQYLGIKLIIDLAVAFCDLKSCFGNTITSRYLAKEEQKGRDVNPYTSANAQKHIAEPSSLPSREAAFEREIYHAQNGELISEVKVRDLAHKGIKEIRIGKVIIITPAAKDLLKEKNIKLIKDNTD